MKEWMSGQALGVGIGLEFWLCVWRNFVQAEDSRGDGMALMSPLSTHASSRTTTSRSSRPSNRILLLS